VKFKVVTARLTVVEDVEGRTDRVAGVIMADSGSNLEWSILQLDITC
jgi:hypothetical protein